MDAYLLYSKIKQLWSEFSPKTTNGMRVCVWTEEGYREVVGAVYNPNLKLIELRLDEE